MATMIRRLLQNNPSLSRLCTINQTLISSSSSSLIHSQSPTIQSNPFTIFSSQTFESSTRSLGNLRAFSSGPVNHNPQNFKYPKHHKASQKGVSNSKISFGEFALQVVEPARISSRQLEAGRRALSRHVRTGGQFWVRVNPDKSMTGKPAGTRMGRGKGAVQYWVAVVKPGKIVYEVGGVPEAIARKAISLAASKMSVRTRFLGHFTRLNKRNFFTSATLISSPSSFPAQFSTVPSNSFSTITSENFQPSTQFFGNCRTFCSSSGPSNLVPIKSPEEFKNSLSKAQDESLPAVFYFTAAWCGPCRLIAPKIIEWSKEYPHVMTYKIDIDEKGMEDTVRKMEITAVPTFIFFHDGKKASHIVGATYDSLIDTMRRLYKQD